MHAIYSYMFVLVYRILPTEAELRSCISPQCSKEALIFNSLVVCPTRDAAALIARADDLRQANLPGRVAVQIQVRSEHDQEIGLGLDRVEKIGWERGCGTLEAGGRGLGWLRRDLADLGVNEFAADVLGREFAVLRHLCERLGEIHQGLPAIGGRYQQDSQ